MRTVAPAASSSVIPPQWISTDAAEPGAAAISISPALIRTASRCPRYMIEKLSSPSSSGQRGLKINRSARISIPVKQRCTRSTLPAMAPR